MSIPTAGTCPHKRGVFIWLGDGPEQDGTYPWVHSTTMSPGHLTVCKLKPFATAGEAKEVCACSHESRRHPPAGPVRDSPVSSRVMPCLDCGCAEFRHRPEDLERYWAAQRGRRGEPGDCENRLMRGEAVPGARGACSREGCAHALTRHRQGRGQVKACTCCRCPGWTDEAGAVMPPEPDTQLALFGSAA